METLTALKRSLSDAELFAAVFLKVLTKDKRLTPFYWNDVQRRLHASRTRRDLVLKARQLGVSTYITGEFYRQAVTSAQGILTLSHDADATAKLRLMSDRFWENHPRADYNGVVNDRPRRKYANASLTTYPETNSMVTVETAGNLKAGRGDTFTHIHGSEVAFWEDAETLLAGAMQGGNPAVILESTPNGAQGYFYDLCMDAIAGRGPWRLHFFPWWMDAEYQLPIDPGDALTLTDEEAVLIERHGLTMEQIAWRRDKMAELKAKFKQEYPEDPVTCFLTSGGGYFGELLADAFTAPGGATYQQGHVYTAGLDFGQTNDFTYMPVFDRTAGVQVDYLHLNKTAWSEQRRRIKNMYRKWHVAALKGERNSIGSVNIEALQEDGIEVEPFDTSNPSKNKMMGEYYDYLENGLKLLDWSVQKAEHYNFVSTQMPSGLWRLAANGDGHDDTVIGNALAATAKLQKPSGHSFKR